MEPDPADPREACGVLNPGGARGLDGELYLFPRLVAHGNFSRIGRARVRFEGGMPVGIERLGIALEPEESWERNPRTAGVEDPRVTFLPPLATYVMTYTAYGPAGPRIALAASPDLTRWERLGQARFARDGGLEEELDAHPNKNAVLFPELVPDPEGEPAYAMLHRPMWAPPLERAQGIWISFTPAETVGNDVRRLPRFTRHRPVAVPEEPWEALKIGAGTPPLRIPEGWLIVYHGVSGTLVPDEDLQWDVRYAAGAMILDAADVSRVTARSAAPLLEPETEAEREGIVPNVVFPTAIDARDCGEADVYYGMADSRIGAARLRRF
jgi:predicted GH43/DUF377 family glycosyl hydrolase